MPRVINVDKNAAYIGAVNDLKEEALLPSTCKRRPTKYMKNNRVPYQVRAQDHRFIKRRVNPGLGFGSYPTALRTIQGYETQNQFISELFGLAA
ncbi:MAG: DDE-type integrase/transposase/recombinase [Chloroflexi bacterium]|nr:DDE-type integrase/transposase/recombinase [Chloroflexota bacterium]